mgnify:CR=1 FL=1
MSVPVPHTAMVLAAGLGTRMRPLTDEMPKPLIAVAGKRLIDRMLDPLVAAGVKRAIVNVHYLPEQVEAAKARPLLGDDPIYVINTDAFWAPESGAPLVALADAFDPEHADALLMVADTGRCLGFDGAGDFFLGDDRRMVRRGDAKSAPWAYAGARIIRPQLYDAEPVERFSALRVWDRLIAERRLMGWPLDRFWLHVGDPGALKDAEMWLRCHGE